MNPVQALAIQDLKREIYHADGKGHVQVETLMPDGFESPSELLDQIDQTSQWPEFFAMAETKPEQWVLDLLVYFPVTKSYSTRCFVEFLTLLSSRDALIILVQDSPRWYWDGQHAELMDAVMTTVTTLIHGTPQSGLSGEIELILLGDLFKALEEIKWQSLAL